MCLAIPGRVVEIFESTDPDFKTGVVLFGQIKKEINLSMVPGAANGDYVLVHAGIAISVVDEKEARKTFDYLKQINELNDLELE